MEPRRITFQEFLRIFKDNKNTKSESRFCFIIGAGASVSSGIKSGAALAKKWLGEIKQDITENEFERWANDVGIKGENPELSYPEIYQKRFENNHKAGHETLMYEMSGKEPSIGYPLFAKVLVETNHNVVITTNFDSLIESSVYRYTDSQPLVIGHENLAHFLDSSTKRPIIAKIHRDLLLEPKNDKKGTSSLPKEWKKPLRQVLETAHIVVVGYGGNDGSLMDLLADIENRNAIYWCTRETANATLSDKVISLLIKDEDRIVSIPNFDSLMIELGDIFECSVLVDSNDIINSEIVKSSINKAENFQKQIDVYADETKGNTSESDAIVKLASDWYEFEMKVKDTENINEKEAIYLEGVKKTNHPSLIGSYAVFLKNIKKDYDKAEKYFLKGLGLAPDSVSINGNYATFLRVVKKDYDKAEKFYLKGLYLAPDSASINGNYASFLHKVKKDDDEAEKYYLKSLELDSGNINNNGNYAIFLQDVRQNYDEAEKYYLKSLELDLDKASSNGNYAYFLKKVRQDYDEAEKYYLKSLELDPDSLNNNGNYAIFLQDIRRNYDEAEKYYLKSLDIDPDDANSNGNYAGFLFAIGKSDKTKDYLAKAWKYTDDQVLTLELCFYEYAHLKDKSAKAEREIISLLEQGVTSEGFNLSKNVEKAIKDGHPCPEKLREYANNITKLNN